jgi:hypothetical protein
MGDRLCTADSSLFAYITQIINHDKGKLNNYIKRKGDEVC